MSALAGKVAIVTGGGSGIGQATAKLFAEQGAQVAVFELDESRAAETLSLLKGNHASRIVDVTSAPQVESAFKDAVANFGRLDILVNVAGGSGRKWGDGPADACTLEGWEKTLALNLDSMFYCCKYGLQAMLPQGGGVIVNVASVLGLVGGDEDFATHAYAASKGAVISLTRSIASYYAPRGIRANVICPGLIATPMSRRAQENERIQSRLTQLQPLTAGFGSPQDVANAALYLASDSSSFVTGAVLTVDGGWTAR
ncbi:MAG: SDR family oxidoreductase [Chloroflexi bacterium]|nr:SDR family oxidoreductase [Chloroflexota bacterium]MCA2001006.1 SDR family oxidoreductase [Chloroflexota bacterium]